MLKVIVCFECFYGSFDFIIGAVYAKFRLRRASETILKCNKLFLRHIRLSLLIH